MTLPTFSGLLAVEFDRRVRRSADDGVAKLAQNAPTDVTSNVVVTQDVTVNDGRTVQVRLDYLYDAAGAAHPTDSVSTVVLRRADARPVLLADVFSDPRRALGAALGRATQVAAQNGNDDPAENLTTGLQDWSSWQSGPTGLAFFFEDGQAGSHAGGLREVEVAWSVVRPWVRDDANALLGPR